MKKAHFNPLWSSSVIDSPHLTPEDRRQTFFSKMHRRYGEYDYFEFHYDVENIRIAGRATQGVIVMRFKEEGDRVISMALTDREQETEKE